MRILALSIVTAGLAGSGAAAEIELDAEVGLGFDNNPYLAPSTPYYDQNLREVVYPFQSPGTFVPVRIGGAFPARLGSENRYFVAEVMARTERYTDAINENADEVYAQLAPGLDWQWDGKGPKERALWVAPLLTHNRRVYFDRDTGASRISSGEDISERYVYTAFGAEVEYEIQPSRMFEYKLRARVEDRDYEPVPLILSEDHVYYWLGLDTEIVLDGPGKLYLDYRYRVRDYNTRPSRSIDGRLRISNPTLRYLYHDFGVTYRYRAGPVWRFYFDLDYRIRKDDFAGYNSYRRPRVGARALYRERRGVRARFAMRYDERRYDNAFIFDRPIDRRDDSPNPNKFYETLTFEAGCEWPLTESPRGRWFVFGDYFFRDQRSADPRWGYARHEIAAGVKWSL